MSTLQAGDRSRSQMAVRAAVVLALVIDAVVHLRLASTFQLAAPGGIGGGALFRIQAGLALVAALYLLVKESRTAYLVAALVLAAAFGAVMITRFVPVPALGPIPAMYEPLWYFEKVLSAAAEGLGVALAMIGYVLLGRGRAGADTASSATRDSQRS